jgi:hypothetical protein
MSAMSVAKVMLVLSSLAAVFLLSCASDEPASAGPPTTTKAASTGGQGGGGGVAATTSTGATGFGGSLTVGSGGADVAQFAELWYSVDQLLVYVSISDVDGAVVQSQTSNITTSAELGQCALTMLADGSLLGARLSDNDQQTYLFHVPEPPRDGSDVTPVALGIMPDKIMLEGLYTDCDGRIYAMDTGVDASSSTGNRLLRFTGDVLQGDFSFAVVTDLGNADVADIDDMSPGIKNNTITDNPGLGIDSGEIYDFNYDTGTGTKVADGGTWGIHALGGPLFLDGVSRLYVLSQDADLYEIDPQTFTLSASLFTGPTPTKGHAGWSGLAGPLTDCETGFVPK